PEGPHPEASPARGGPGAGTGEPAGIGRPAVISAGEPWVEEPHQLERAVRSAPGRLVIRMSTPQAWRRRATSSSSTVHTATFRPGACLRRTSASLTRL